MLLKSTLLAFLALGTVLADCGAQISGVIRCEGDCDGEPLPGVMIRLAGAQLSRPMTVVSDAEGRYRLDGVPPGKFEITAFLAGFGRQVAAALCLGGADQQIDFDLYLHGTICTTVIIELDAAGNPLPPAPTTEEITGTVIDGSGREIPGALVQILSNERVLATTPVDSAGKFAVMVPFRSATAVRIRAAGFADRTISDFRSGKPVVCRIYRACP